MLEIFTSTSTATERKSFKGRALLCGGRTSLKPQPVDTVVKSVLELY